MLVALTVNAQKTASIDAKDFNGVENSISANVNHTGCQLQS
jgi:hypothetical protein